MKILINQPWGIGDCIYSMTLVRRLCRALNAIGEPTEVTWPVFPHFVEQLQRAYPFINWVVWSAIAAPYDRMDEHDWNGYRYIPLRWANELVSKDYNLCMSDKYKLFGMDYNTWREDAMWQRDTHMEAMLVGHYAPGNSYCVVNNTWGSDCKLKTQIPGVLGYDNIVMKPVDGYSLFDWAMLLEGAAEIHTVSTSILYLLELLGIPGEKIHLYPRPTDPTFKQVSYLFSKPYNLHD